MPDLAAPAIARTPPPDRLRSADIVAAARALLLEHGAEAFSMRLLAARLGVGAPAIYRRVGDKNRLLTLVADGVLGELERPVDDGNPPEEAIRRFAVDHLRLVLRHRVLLQIFAKGVVDGPNLLKNTEAWLALFVRFGLDEVGSVHAYKAVMRHIIGSIPQFASSTTLDGRSWTQTLDGLSGQDYPIIRRVRQSLADDYYGEQDFDVGMTIILSGLETMRPSSAAASVTPG